MAQPYIGSATALSGGMVLKLSCISEAPLVHYLCMQCSRYTSSALACQVVGYLDDEAEIVEPLCVLQGRVPLCILTRETKGAEVVITLPHCVNVGDIQVGQLGTRVVCDVLRAFALIHYITLL